MPVTVLIPSALHKLTNGASTATGAGATVGEVLDSLETQFPGIRERLYDGEGRLRRFTNIFLNNEDIRFLQNVDTPVKDGDELSIVPQVAGGA